MEEKKEGIIVLGAGGHAKVCLELLYAMGQSVAYCIGLADSPDKCLKTPVTKSDNALQQLRHEGYHKIFVAIGSNVIREKLAYDALSLGYEFVNAISPAAHVSPSAKLGRGIAIMAGAVINAETLIADFVIVNTGATIDHDCSIQPAVHIGPQCGLAGEVIVGKRSFLGVGCKVIPRMTIGEDVTLGAGSVVITDIKSDCIALGVPAKVIKENEIII